MVYQNSITILLKNLDFLQKHPFTIFVLKIKLQTQQVQ